MSTFEEFNKNQIDNFGDNTDGNSRPPFWKEYIYKIIGDLKGKRILDIGCGNFQFLIKLVEEGKEISNTIYGLDLNEPIVDYRKHGLKFIKGDVCDDSAYDQINGDKFDVILCLDVVEHVLNPEKILLNAKKLLKDDGFMIISTPNYGSLFSRLKFLFGKHIETYNSMHIRLFNYSLAKSLFRDTGLKLYDMRIFLSNPRLIWAIFHYWPFTNKYFRSLAGLLGLNFIFVLKK